jgi:hypothetical protein
MGALAGSLPATAAGASILAVGCGCHRATASVCTHNVRPRHGLSTHACDRQQAYHRGPPVFDRRAVAGSRRESVPQLAGSVDHTAGGYPGRQGRGRGNAGGCIAQRSQPTLSQRTVRRGGRQPLQQTGVSVCQPASRQPGHTGPCAQQPHLLSTAVRC